MTCFPCLPLAYHRSQVFKCAKTPEWALALAALAALAAFELYVFCKTAPN